MLEAPLQKKDEEIDSPEGCENEPEKVTAEPSKDDEEFSMRRMYIRRNSPPVTINRNGSRSISPIDIVRSNAGREEIRRQQSDTAKEQTEQKRKQDATGTRNRDST